MKKKSTELMENIATYVKTKAEEAMIEKKNKEIAQQKIFLMGQINNAHEIIRQNLFDVMHQNHYSNLEPIVVPSNIRALKWHVDFTIIPTQALFYYTISKKNTDVLAQAVLNSLASDINHDIASFTNVMITMQGIQNMSIIYPLLYAGIYVVDIRDIGTSIELKIACNQKFG